MNTKKPDAYVAAAKIVEIIDSCLTPEHLLVAKNCIKAFNIMYEGKWDWVYAEDFIEILYEKETSISQKTC